MAQDTNTLCQGGCGKVRSILHADDPADWLCNECRGKSVTYLEPPYTVTIEMLWWQKQGLQQTATGYGRKLTTEYMLHLPDAPRAYRVYAVCFSNVASFYILKGGKALYLRDWELESARDAAMGK